MAEYTRQRAYTRYAFSATAEILDSAGAAFPGKVTNISYGGCRLLTGRRLPIGASVTLKIQAQTEAFEATAQVMHSTEDDMGVMFGNIPTRSLFVLDRWIGAAKVKPT